MTPHPRRGARLTRPLAAVAAGLLTAAGWGALAAAPPAQAAGAGSATVTTTLGCEFYLSKAATDKATYPDTFTLSETPAAPAAGSAVTVTLAAADGPSGAPVPIGAGDETVKAAGTVGSTGFTLSNTDTAAGGSGSYPKTAAKPDAHFGPYTLAGSYTAAAGASGEALAIDTIDFFYQGGGTADYYCSADAGTPDVKESAAPPPTGSFGNDGPTAIKTAGSAAATSSTASTGAAATTSSTTPATSSGALPFTGPVPGLPILGLVAGALFSLGAGAMMNLRPRKAGVSR